MPDYAGFWQRFLAALLDGLILGVPGAILSAALGDGIGVRVGYGYTPGERPLVSLLNTVIAVLYYALLEGGPRGQTVGKMALGIRVADIDRGGTIGHARAVGRYFARILSAIPCLLGYFWMLWDERKQTWHDKLVRSVVVTSD